MTVRSRLRVRHDVERIRDEGIDRVGDQESAYDEAYDYTDVSERLIGALCQWNGSGSDVST